MDKPRDYSQLTVEQKAKILDELVRMLDGKAEFSHRKRIVSWHPDPRQATERLVSVYKWEMFSQNCGDVRKAFTGIINPEL